MAKLERTYTIPLRKQILKTAKYRRAKKAVRTVKEFLKKHMKAESIEKVKVGKYLNLKIWERGIKNPITKVTVHAIKDDDGIVHAEIIGAPVEKKITEKAKPKTDEKAEEKKAAKEPEIKVATKKEETREGHEQTEKEEKAEALKKEPLHHKLKGKETTQMTEKADEKKSGKKIFPRRSEK